LKGTNTGDLSVSLSGAANALNLSGDVASGAGSVTLFADGDITGNNHDITGGTSVTLTTNVGDVTGIDTIGLTGGGTINTVTIDAGHDISNITTIDATNIHLNAGNDISNVGTVHTTSTDMTASDVISGVTTDAVNLDLNSTNGSTVTDTNLITLHLT